MIRVLCEQRPVWRSEVGRRGRLQKRTAYLDAAWQAWRAKYPCECEHETGYRCGEHAHLDDPEGESKRADYRRKVIDRLARWLLWRDSWAQVAT